MTPRVVAGRRLLAEATGWTLPLDYDEATWMLVDAEGCEACQDIGPKAAALVVFLVNRVDPLLDLWEAAEIDRKEHGNACECLSCLAVARLEAT